MSRDVRIHHLGVLDIPSESIRIAITFLLATIAIAGPVFFRKRGETSSATDKMIAMSSIAAVSALACDVLSWIFPRVMQTTTVIMIGVLVVWTLSWPQVSIRTSRSAVIKQMGLITFIIAIFFSNDVAQSINASWTASTAWLVTIMVAWVAASSTGMMPMAARPGSRESTRIILLIACMAVGCRIISQLYAHAHYEPIRRTAWLATEILLNPEARNKVDAPGLNPIVSEARRTFGLYAWLLVGSCIQLGIVAGRLARRSSKHVGS